VRLGCDGRRKGWSTKRVTVVELWCCSGVVRGVVVLCVGTGTGVVCYRGDALVLCVIEGDGTGYVTGALVSE